MFFMSLLFFKLCVGHVELTETTGDLELLRLQHAGEWNAWKRSYNKVYFTKRAENFRFRVWLANREKVALQNKRFEEGKELFTQDMNKFADMLLTKLDQTLLRQVPTHHFYRHFEDADLLQILSQVVPDSINWALEGWTTNVKPSVLHPNGWSFSATKAIEAQIYNHTRVSRLLSRQEIVDCVEPKDRPHITIDAFLYILYNGITFDNEYPMLRLGRAVCKRVQNEGPVVTNIRDYRLLQPNNEENLKAAVALIGPISVSIRVTHKFFFYHTGIFYDYFCGVGRMALNHAVLLVGYGTDPVGGDFWIIQNNWGTQWGENGFPRMARTNKIDCGITAAPIYPII